MLKHSNSRKLVYSATAYHRHISLPPEWDKTFGDGNYSGIITGASGSGKDSTTGFLVCNDLANGRTPIILDVKMEYSLAALCQNDRVLANHLIANDLAGRGYMVNVWVPYVEGLNQKPHFKRLLQLHHPNIRIRPFRILKDELVSEDTANMSLQKSAMQSYSLKNGTSKLTGTSAVQNAYKEEMGRKKLGLDDQSMYTPGCGWEYVDFNEMTKNHEINIITTYFLLGQNIISTVAYMIAIVNELLTIGMRTHHLPDKDHVFSIVVPELQIIMPKKVRALDNVVNTLQYAMIRGLLLMRSFGVRFRINLQNLSALHEDMLSQSRLFTGRTSNPKDLSRLSIFNIGKEFRRQMLYLQTGNFIDIFRRKKFNVVPYFHKARENEYLVRVLEDYKINPAGYLFETRNVLLSEIVNHEELGLRFPCTVKEYNKKVKAWIKIQPEYRIKDLPDTDDQGNLIISDDESLDVLNEEYSRFETLCGEAGG